ncbi:uncharacterized protein Triagg1_3612 [Trichoderma aggressivum f. europaeum]|uniref:Nucleoside phosphorylase domain-containing protein n=1 Tax=Trichoderma aggressivum f. europaeum TaxID=173218 RepID=A0AAE1IGD2_9HYPO|nr:hypothetical protein Triagg1_3612 [Trichoderma aggressivum f. europaeum]
MLLTLRFAALQKDDETLMDDDVKSDSVDIDDASDASKGNDLGSLSDIDSRADITLKDMDDVDNEGDAMDVDDDVGKDDVIIPDTDLELVYIPRQYDGLATEDDDFLQKVIESGAYQSRQGEHEHSASHPGTDYTIGWICALPIEYVAAQAFLDEKHEGAEYVPPNDNNDYTLGRIGRHNLVIAMLRYDEYGVSSAAGVARDMLHTFPQIKLVLMVGIGGGAPSSRHDIRLGDVVVGVPKDGMSGVIQYDFGKVMQGQGFQEAEFLNPPPMLLRTAVSGLRSQYESHGNQILEEVERVLEKRPRLRMKFARPKITTDRLYRSHVLHPPNNETDCAVACGDDPSNLVRRSNRNEDDEEDQAIHYGLIASANRLMRDASVRDELAKKGVLCFEMEAAGLMNNFPCLVIRGICDYADSHINKTWQGYAAMAAAAYARDLLSRIPPKRVEAEKKISDILPGPYEGSQQHSPHLADSRWNMAEEPQDFTENQLGTQEDLANERLSEKDRECHQLFRLTSGNKDTTYEWYKEQVEIRVKDTCLWFLNHEYYQEWLNQESGLLLITADPGCGKSVLAKYLIDHGLPRSATICYFFFKDQDQNTSNQALCALLHQLFSQQPLLIKHATPHFDKEGQDLINSTQSLWNILQKATRDPEAGSTIMVLDALDECAEPEFADLVRNMESQFQSDYLSSSKNKLKYLLTCRPYEQITSQFRGLLQHSPNVHIQGEEESEIISLEVQNVITHRIKQLSEKGKFPTGILNYLERTLQETTHRTYLWVYLVFNYLEENHLFTRTQKEVELIIQTHPKSVTEAFEKILNKSENEYLVRKALSIILAANRPLTVSEMNIAMNINDTAQDDTTNTFDGLDSEDQGSFKSRLRSLCGLFISVDHGKVYFLDEAAREFLLADLASPTDTPSGLHWHHSITTRQAHNVLAELCVLYLNLFNSGISARTRAHWATSYDYKAFLKYSAENWGAHFRQAWVADDAAIVPFAKRICDLNSTGYLAWSETYWKTSVMAIDGNLTDLIIASYYGHHAVVKLLVEEGADIEAKDGDGQTPLLWAAIVGHETVVKLLVEKGADIEVEDNFGQTPLSRAAENGHEAIVQLLAEKGAGIEAEREDCLAPILWAAMAGHEAVVKLLIEQGADIEVKDEDGQTPLSWAAVAGHEAVVKLLVEKGANIEAKDGDGRTPLLQAAEYGRLAIVTLLVEKGADVKVKDDLGQTPLMQAAGNGYKAIVKLLIEEGTDIEVKDNFGQTALSRAAGFRYRAIGKLLVEKLLVEKEIDIEAKEDKSG